ncbi:uncharacterized protein [Rutidosis leptorrhynchoides]|uniref:uncharacterized protein n=1 Tax=Rutidosis leptorrhynchoides TaxID=125765 RepID=UPI003A9A4500
MRLASWNTRGLGNKSRGRMAGALVNLFQVEFLAIQETMVQSVSQPVLNEVWRHYAFDAIQVGATGRSGGLVSIWRSDFFSLIKCWKTKYWIATIMRYLPSNNLILIVNVYAPQQEQAKKIVWSQLTIVAHNWPGPLCYLGDFNAVVSPDERLREIIDYRSIANFNNFIINANLIDQVLVNDDFTWEGPGWAAFVISKNLRLLKFDLKAWCVTQRSQPSVDLKQAESEITRLKTLFKQRDLIDIEMNDLVSLKKLKKQLAIKLESKHRLHSRLLWLKLGDKNSRFFHLVSEIKQQSSFIAGMQINNKWEEDPSIVKEFAISFYDNLFSRSNSTCSLSDSEWASLNLHHLSAQQRLGLESVFESKELEGVISGFDGNKTPGPDGFTLQFFKKSWHFLEDNIMEVFDQFYVKPSFPKGFNSSFIVLIPKSNPAKTIDQLRPISLINATYKILAKTLANRLKNVIPSIISENQNGLVPSRLLIDGVMVVNEVVHMAKKKKNPIILLKIDFSKAYDCVSHEFLFIVLEKLGFGAKFISWIKTCISNINFSVLLNGSPSREGVMNRGLRQGDHLSSFLFIIVAEVLSKLLSLDLSNGSLSGCHFGNGQKINHSQFANDTIIFAHPSVQELNRIKYVLYLFYKLSGLQMNAIKTTMCGIHVSRDDMMSFSAIFDCKVGVFPLEYLGIPIGFNRDRIAMWNPILLKFKKKLAGWKGRCHSFGGHLVMVNAVISNLPIHYMSIYKAPVSILKQLERYRRNFLWGGDCLKKKTYLVKWESVCLPKDMGGLGITPLRLKNVALLAKWWSKLNSSKLSLWKSIVVSSFGPSFRGKVMNDVSSLRLSLLSPIWRDLINLHKDEFSKSIVGSNIWKWKVGNGACILFWYDSWANGHTLKDDFLSLFLICSDHLLTVNQARWPSDCDQPHVEWVLHFNRTLDSYECAKWIELKSFLSAFSFNDNVPDRILWNDNACESFLVADAVRIIIQTGSNIAPVWPKVIWNNNVPSKVMLFHWLTIKKSIPVRVVLANRHILPSNISKLCVWCMLEEETIEHLLLHCNWSFKIWAELFRWWNIRWVIPSSIEEFLFDWYYGMGINASKFWKMIGPATLWAIWIAQNDIIFNGKFTCRSVIVRNIKLKVFLWASNLKFCHGLQSYVWEQNPFLLCL